PPRRRRRGRGALEKVDARALRPSRPARRGRRRRRVAMSAPQTVVREVAVSLGFEVVGVASVEPLERDGAALSAWLAAGCHGEMDYLADPSRDRARATSLLADALSVVTVAVDYDSEAPPFAAEGRFGRVA